MVSQFNKSLPQEPIDPTPGVQGMFQAFNSILNAAVGNDAQRIPNATEEYLDAFEPSLQFLKKFEGKNVLITGATGGIGYQVVKRLFINDKQSKKL